MELPVKPPPGYMTASGVLTEALDHYYQGLEGSHDGDGGMAAQDLVNWVKSLTDRQRAGLILDLLSYQALVHAEILHNEEVPFA